MKSIEVFVNRIDSIELMSVAVVEEIMSRRCEQLNLWDFGSLFSQPEIEKLMQVKWRILVMAKLKKARVIADFTKA